MKRKEQVGNKGKARPVPAVHDNGGKTVHAKAITTGKHKNLEIGKGMSEELKALVSDHHAFQPEFFQPRIVTSRS